MTVPQQLQQLLAQYDFSIEQLLGRISGMSDAEYLWEPVAGCWSIRLREDARSNNPLGAGEWVLDFSRPEPDPPAFTTIAWRLTHLASGLVARADYTNGTKSLTLHDLEIPATAAEGVEVLRSAAAAWRSALLSAGEENINTVGYSELPWGLDPELPFIEIVWWMNKEVIHHGAEIALLRDLYRAQQDHE